MSVFAAEIAGERLKITLRISNYSGWAAIYPNWSRPGSKVLLRDQFGNLYNQRYESHDPKTVAAGKSTDDYLLFDAPPLPVAMDLDLGVTDSDKPFEFKLMNTFIYRNPVVTTAALPRTIPRPEPASPPPPPPPVPYNREDDPNIRMEVIDEYNEGISSINRRSLGMSFDRGNRFRQTEPEKLRKALAKKFMLEEIQIKRILRGL